MNGDINVEQFESEERKYSIDFRTIARGLTRWRKKHGLLGTRRLQAAKFRFKR
jgi:hypothetical protein